MEDNTISRDEDALADVSARLEGLQSRAQELLDKVEADPADAKALREELDREIKPALAELSSERDSRIKEMEMKGVKEQVTTLTQAIEALRKPVDFDFGGVPVSEADAVYGQKAIEQGKPARSFFADVLNANKGDQDARTRLMKGLDGKAMTEGTNTAGGYLVQPEVLSELITLREQAAVLRPLFSAINVNTNSIEVSSVTGGMTAGWVAELASKPSADMTFGQVTASVFTAAGLGVVSNQLLADASPSIDSLVITDIAKRLAALEEVAFIDGDGSGKPTGILNTSGVNSTTLTSTTIPDLLDAIVDGITNIQINYQGNPSHIVMHPRTWARIMKARESSAPSTYLIGAGSTAFGRRANDPLPVGELFGLPVVVTKNMPITKGTGSNESRIIVGAFNEGLILDRQGVTVDQSPHVYFTTNQTVFRAEERVGFTAARYPKAFSVIGGAGLAAG